MRSLCEDDAMHGSEYYVKIGAYIEGGAQADLVQFGVQFYNPCYNLERFISIESESRVYIQYDFLDSIFTKQIWSCSYADCYVYYDLEDREGLEIFSAYKEQWDHYV